MQTMLLHQKRFEAIRQGKKRNTMRKGYKDIKLGPLTFCATEDPDNTRLDVDVSRIDVKRFIELSIEDSVGGGYATWKDMENELLSIYPDIDDNDPVTVVWFDANNSSESGDCEVER